MKDKRILRGIEDVVSAATTITVVLVIVLFVMAVFDTRIKAEPPMGSFDSMDFNEGWIITGDGEQIDSPVPGEVEIRKRSDLILKNTLPDNITDGMTFTLETNREDVKVFVDGQKRIDYNYKDLRNGTYYTTHEIIVVDLNAEDAGKNITIIMKAKEKVQIHGFKISNGNNSWFEVIRNNLAKTILGILVFIAGIITVIGYAIIHRRIKGAKTILNLGLLINMIGIWILSESELKQFIFKRPSLTSCFSYLSISAVSILVIMYIDGVQKRKYHLRYLLMEVLLCVQLIINSTLSILQIAEWHDTLKFLHMWMLVGIIVVIIGLLEDILKKDYLEYKATIVGIVIFVGLCLGELMAYYNAAISKMGIFMSIGLIVLLAATLLQLVIDEIEKYKEKEKAQEKSTISTIHTIASSIDAKDEYTGGHSTRVGEYAGVLAKAMAKEYGFSSEDILRIRYIGYMHDLGKIGVADTILNKAGKLTNEEFMLMKKHVIIGSELIGAMNYVEGLWDGVRFHHERYDGHGYPDGLEGENIPLIARILCIADCYDAMTSNRVYRRRLSDEEVRNEFVKCAGSQFDPKIAEIFVELIDEGKIEPITIGGMAIGDTGDILKSSAVELKMIRDEESQEEITNPSHIRMLCYIIKLAEKKNMTVDVFYTKFTPPFGREKFSDVSKSKLGKHDISLEYTENSNIIALFGYDKDEAEKKMVEMAKESSCSFERLSAGYL